MIAIIPPPFDWRKHEQETREKENAKKLADEQTADAVRAARERCARTIDSALQTLYKESNVIATDIQLQHHWSYSGLNIHFHVSIKGNI
jgi:hypothetical protein